MNLFRKVTNSGYSGVGMDIGNFSIKVAALKRPLFSKKRVFSFGVELIPQDATIEQKSELMHKVLENAGIAAKRVNISVCGPDVICRYIRLPLMQVYELQDAIEMEWDKHITLKKDEVVWDYTLLDKVIAATEKYMFVLVVAVRKVFLEERLELLKIAGLEPGIINVDALALVNTFKFTSAAMDKRPVVILNLGEYFTNEVILKEGILLFSRDIQIGGHDITGIIADRLHLNWPEAEELKYNPEKSKSPEITNLIKSVLDNLVNELRLSLEYFKRELEDEIGLIYIFGGSAHLYQLDAFLNQSLGIPIKRWSIPLGLFELKPRLSPDVLEKHSSDLAIAIGLALTKEDSL